MTGPMVDVQMSAKDIEALIRLVKTRHKVDATRADRQEHERAIGLRPPLVGRDMNRYKVERLSDLLNRLEDAYVLAVAIQDEEEEHETLRTD